MTDRIAPERTLAPSVNGATRAGHRLGVDAGHPNGTIRPLRILILTTNYAPEVTGPGQINTDFAEQLVARGHDVVVATTFPFYPRWRWEARPGLRRVESLNGVSVRRFRIVLPHNRRAIWRIACDTSFALSTFPNVLGIPRPDCIIAISPPVQIGITAAMLRRLWGSPVCMLVKDLPLDLALAVGMMREGKLLRLGLSLERSAYRLADRIVVLDEVFSTTVQARGVPARKLRVIPNWVDLDGIHPMDQDAELRHRLGASSSDCLVLHTGNIGEKQQLTDVVQAAALLDGPVGFKFALIGDGSQRQLVERALKQSGLLNVRLLPPQPSELYPRLLAAADILLLNQRANVIDSVAPRKLLSYMAAGRPIVAAVSSHSVAARLIQEAGCGTLVPPEDSPALAQAIQSLSGSPALMRTMGMLGRAYIEHTAEKGRLLDEWEGLLATLVAGGREVDRRKRRDRTVGQV